MAMCLLCTRAKESLPWPIKDRFVECGSPRANVQPHVWYGTDLDSHPIVLARQATRRIELSGRNVKIKFHLKRNYRRTPYAIMLTYSRIQKLL